MGHGTLQGILSKIPYLHELGVDIVWLSPIYESPQADMGYDISNYRDIDRRYGTLKDWDAILDAVHTRGMKLVMDLVVNHTSSEVRDCLENSSLMISTPGFRRAGQVETIPSATGTSGETRSTTKLARGSHQITGNRSSECMLLLLWNPS